MMSATILQFPPVADDPGLPSLEQVTWALRKHNPGISDDDCRTITRKLRRELLRKRRARERSAELEVPSEQA